MAGRGRSWASRLGVALATLGGTAWGQVPSTPEAERATEQVRLSLQGARLGSEPARRTLAEAISRESRAHRLDPLLVAAVIEVESGFNPAAVSQAGAVGLMQLMPATASWLSSRQGEQVGDPLFGIDCNVHLGCAYLARLLREFGSVERALVAYNMGPTAARRELGGPRARERLEGYPRRVERVWAQLESPDGVARRFLPARPCPGALRCAP